MNSKLKTPQERAARNEQMVTQYTAGLSTEKIAELWGVTACRVVQILNSRGVAFRRRRNVGVVA
jgi:hypothetical protein